MKNSEINALTDEELEKLINEKGCPYEPEQMLGQPIGMFHCPVCGEMVLAGMSHPKPLTAEDLAFLDKLGSTESDVNVVENSESC